MVSQVSGGPGEVLVAEAFEQGDGDVAQDGQYPRCLAVAGLVFVLLKENVSAPVEAIFNAPVPAHPARQLPRAGLVGRQRGHRIDGFQVPLPGTDGPGFAGDLHGLEGVGELDAGAEGGAFDGADDLPAVGLGTAAIPDGNLLPGSV